MLYIFYRDFIRSCFDERFIKGQRFKVPYSIKGLVKVLDKNKRFLGIGEIKENQILQPVKVFI